MLARFVFFNLFLSGAQAKELATTARGPRRGLIGSDSVQYKEGT